MPPFVDAEMTQEFDWEPCNQCHQHCECSDRERDCEGDGMCEAVHVMDERGNEVRECVPAPPSCHEERCWQCHHDTYDHEACETCSDECTCAEALRTQEHRSSLKLTTRSMRPSDGKQEF